MIKGSPGLRVFQQLIAVPFQRANQRLAVQRASTSDRIRPLINDAVRRGSRTGRIGFIACGKVTNKGLATGIAKLLRHIPGPGHCPNNPGHHRRARLLHHTQSKVGHHYLHVVEAELANEAHGLDHLLAKQHQHQHFRLRVLGFLQRLAQLTQRRVGERYQGRAMGLGGRRVGKVAHRLLGAVAPGVIGGHIVITLAGKLLLQLGGQYPRRHPGVVALAEHIAMTGRAGRVVGIGKGAKVQQATLAGALPGSDGNRAGGSTKQHPCPFTR